MSKGDVLKIPVALEVNSAAFSSCLVCYVWGFHMWHATKDKFKASQRVQSTTWNMVEFDTCTATCISNCAKI